MKVINVIGYSCSGKTTFISRLVVELQDRGTVATIKHLGHHNYNLDKGKDTTVFYERGVALSGGIDSSKTVLTIRKNDLTSILDLLADQCVEFTVVEGFKTLGLPAVVIGDLESDKVLFRNPTLDEILNGLEQFPEYDTLNGIGTGLRRAELKVKICSLQGIEKSGISEGGFRQNGPNINSLPISAHPPESIVMTVTIPIKLTDTQFSLGYNVFQKILTGISREVSQEYYPVQVSVGIRNCWNFSIPCEFLIAVIAEDCEDASVVVSAIHERIKIKITSGSP